MTEQQVDTPTSGGIVVGVDGSPLSQLAVEWGARQAALEGRPLVLAHAEQAPNPAMSASWFGALGVDTATLHEQIRRGMRPLLEEATDAARADHPDLEVQHVARLDDPRQVLLTLSEDAAAVVVGTRGHGPVRSLLLGSVSHAAVMRAHCPAVVVREPVADQSRGVVVGAESLDRDRPLLEFAYRVAQLRDVPVTLVRCFWDAGSVAQGRQEIGADEPGFDDERAELAQMAADIGGSFPDVTTHQVLATGFVDERLIELSARAALVVVGHRDKPRLNEIVYGSLAPRVTERAHSTVAVIPEPSVDEPGSRA